MCGKGVMSSMALITIPADCKPVIALCKPQFEVGRKTADKHRGVIKDPRAVETAVDGVRAWLAEHGWQLQAEIESPVTGTKGNVERLLRLETPAG